MLRGINFKPICDIRTIRTWRIISSRTRLGHYQQYYPMFPMTLLGPQGMMQPQNEGYLGGPSAPSQPPFPPLMPSRAASRPRASTQIRLWPLRILETAIKLTNREDESCKLRIRRVSVGLYRKCRTYSLHTRNDAPKQPKRQPNVFTRVYFD